MKRIHISFIVDSNQHRLFYTYVEYVEPISTMKDRNFRPWDGDAPIVPGSLDDTSATKLFIVIERNQ